MGFTTFESFGWSFVTRKGVTHFLGIGFLILLGTLVFARFAASFEALVASHLCGASITYRHRPLGKIRWEDMKAISITGLMRPFFTAVVDLSTWRAVGFLLLKFPLSVATFTIGVTFLSTSLKMAAAPFLYRFTWYQSPHEFWYVNRFDTALVAMLLGLVLLGITYYLLPRLAWLHCKLAQLFLD